MKCNVSNEVYAMKKLLLLKFLTLITIISNAQSKADSAEIEKLKIYDKDFISIKKLGFNTDKAEYAPAFYSNGIVFSKSKEVKNTFNKDQKIKSSQKAKLYFSSLDLDFNVASPLKVKLKGLCSFGTASFHNASKTIYYSTPGSSNGTKINKNAFGVYSAKFDLNTNKWNKYNTFPYNGSFYSIVHPCISKSGKKLFFSSDMHSGMGGMDIYVSEWVNNEWTEPENLGPNVNTSGDELYPFIFEDSLLYFASNGRVGLGGLDIFVYNFSEYSTKNLGAPINSSQDDFGLIRQTKIDNGYFSSSRNQGNADIYAYKSIRPKPRVITINITDEETGKNLSAVKLNISSNLSKAIDLFNLQDGVLEGLKFEIGEKYKFYVVKEGYENKTEFVVFDKNSKQYSIKLKKSVPVESPVVTEQPQKQNILTQKKKAQKSIAQTTTPIDNSIVSTEQTSTIYFDFNTFKINEESSYVLDDIIYLLKDQPTLKVTINSYTDSRGSAEYNRSLSKKRAQSTAKYLADNGISKRRIKAIGNGEKFPYINCKNSCTEEEHFLNRRTVITLK